MGANDEEVKWHGTRKVRTSGDSVEVTIPPAAVENSGLIAGNDVTVMSEDDGGVILLPQTLEDNIRENLE